MKRRINILSLLIFMVFWNVSFGQKQLPYYNVDKEIKIKGTIQKIIIEPRYKNNSPFLIVILEEKNTRQMFNVEISPVRFFSVDFHKGANLEVVGSIYSKEERSQNIIARQIRFRGEILVLRDKHGFPVWRGGGMMHKKKRKGKDF